MDYKGEGCAQLPVPVSLQASRMKDLRAVTYQPGAEALLPICEMCGSQHMIAAIRTCASCGYLSLPKLTDT
jgi:hypothetical protein